MSLDDIDLSTRTQEILLAASNHDLNTLKPFLRVPGAACVQDPDTGFTPLHAAIAACGYASQSGVSDGTGPASLLVNDSTHDCAAGMSNGKDESTDLEKAKATIKELFLSGAIWNDLDTNNETPGCLAWRLGQKELYDLVVEAGVRAELLMNLMGGYERLPDEDSETEQEAEENEKDTEFEHNQSTDPGTVATNTELSTVLIQDVTSREYLGSTLIFTPSKILDASSNGVMMSWETPIMSLTAELLASIPGLRVLNIGFGLGIVDRFFAATEPSVHHIIEAHPDVLAKLQSATGAEEDANRDLSRGSGRDPENNFSFFGPSWQQHQGHVLHAGKWQDIVPQLLEQETVFDVIYFDTFGEDYSQLKIFFSEYVIGLLAPDGRFGFFNGLGADRRVCYDVYCRVVECDLLDAGFDVEWVDVDVDMAEVEDGDEIHVEVEQNGAGREKYQGLGQEGEGEWKDVKRRYWTLEKVSLVSNLLLTSMIT